MPFAATAMDLEMTIPSEVSQRKTNTVLYHIYVESKIWHIWHICRQTYLQNRSRLTDTENRLVVAMGEASGGGKDWKCGMSRQKLMDKALLHSAGNYIQYPVINHHGKEYLFKKGISVYN